MSCPAPTTRELIERGARMHRGRTALVAEGRPYTFEMVDALANRLANAMAGCGIEPGARVALLVGNGAISVPLDFACVKAGVNRVPLNPRLAHPELVAMLADADCRWLICGPELTERARALKAEKESINLLTLGPQPDAIDLAGEADRSSEVAPGHQVGAEDVIITLYTSGTTGVLKAAQHTQASYAAICRNIMLNLMPLSPADRMLHAASLIHASGTFVLPVWLRGGCSVVLPGFEPSSYLAAIAREGITVVNLVPTMLQMLLADRPGCGAAAESLRHIVYGASPMAPAVLEDAMSVFGQQQFWQYYGQTEAPLCLTVLRPEDHCGSGLASCGRPAADVEIRIAREPGATDDIGEIVVRTAAAARGYHGAVELTAATFDLQGWVHTRDMGRFDENGFLHLCGRSSDMIVTGGYNVYPLEVENALLSHPDVCEAAVIGQPDEKWVERVVALVVLEPGATIEAQDLINHVTARIASHKKPRLIQFVTSLPKTSVGKTDRAALRRMLSASASSNPPPKSGALIEL